MRFSIDFIRAFFVLLRQFFPIWGGIAILISLMGILIAQFEEELSVSEALYFAWVTGTTVGYGDLAPTTGITRVLAIIVAIMGIVLTGIIVTMAIEAAKIVVENNTSIQEFKQSVKERAKQRVSRNRETQPKLGDEER
jgi:type VI protein secretion system component VasK